MDNDALPPPQIDDATRVIKAATRALIKLAGGNVCAAVVAGRSKSTVQRWGSLAADDMDWVIPAGCAVALEADTGEPLVTRAMAELNGRSIGPGAAERQRTLLSAHRAVSRAYRDYDAAFDDAAEDGVFTPGELNGLADRAGQVNQATARMQAIAAADAAGAIKIGGA